MMSPATIRALGQAVARKAAREHKTPYMIEADDLFDQDTLVRALRSTPHLGTHRPKGYKLTDQLFVDSSGYGSEDEPAFTFGQFCAKVRQNGVGFGYGIIEEGQFQVVVGVFVSNSR